MPACAGMGWPHSSLGSRAMVAWGKEQGVELPVAEAVHRVAHEGLDPLAALKALMAREPKEE